MDRAIAWRQGIVDRKRSALELLALTSDYLTPGPYLLEPEGHVRHLFLGRWPRSVVATKKPRHYPGQGGEVKGRLKALAGASTPPVLSAVRHRHAPPLEPGLLGVCALGTNRGNAVLFSRDGRHVLRVYRDGRVPEAEVTLRPLLERHLGLSASRVLPGRAVVLERFAVGEPFGRLDEDRRESTFRRLLERYAPLVAAEARRPKPPFHDVAPTEEVARATARWLVPSDAAGPGGPIDLRAPGVPSHGDVYGDNLLVAADGTFELIDFERCAVLPIGYDPLNLVLNESEEGRHDLATSLLSGAFDAELRRLWAAAGLVFDRAVLWEALRAAMVLHLRVWGRPRTIDWSGLPVRGA